MIASQFQFKVCLLGQIHKKERVKPNECQNGSHRLAPDKLNPVRIR